MKFIFGLLLLFLLLLFLSHFLFYCEITAKVTSNSMFYFDCYLNNKVKCIIIIIVIIIITDILFYSTTRLL